jgi:galactokinase
MTGGGFGGCTVNLVRREALDEFQKVITEQYHLMTGLAASIYLSQASDGAREI